MSTNSTTIKTLHITKFEGYPWNSKENDQSGLHSFLNLFVKKNKNEDEAHDIKKYSKMRDLMKYLYDNSLKDDPKFHFFYEPEIIIRISDATVLEKTCKLLEERSIEHVVYEYPLPKTTEDSPLYPQRYGEEKGGIVLAYLDLFLTIFHAHSVAAIIMDDEEHFEYMERVIHTMFNPRLYTRKEEGLHLASLSIFKAGRDEVINHLTK